MILKGVASNVSQLLVWPLIVSFPLLLTRTSTFHHSHFSVPFASYWGTDSSYPNPLGLTLGITAVGVGQLFAILYQYFHYKTNERTRIQLKKREYGFAEGVFTHLSQPEGFGLMVGYLSVTWMFNILPQEYYSFEGGIRWREVAMSLVVTDFLQFVMHQIEHVASPKLYKVSHKPHHRFINPRYFDAFNGSGPDTVLMILVPLLGCSQIVRNCNVWSYMAFGSLYANWLCLIHCEYVHVWDRAFRILGLGTPADHHVHHAFFNYNFGHLFMWWDWIYGTYRSPSDELCQRVFTAGL